MSARYFLATVFVLCAGYIGDECETDIDECTLSLCYYFYSLCRIHR